MESCIKDTLTKSIKEKVKENFILRMEINMKVNM